MSQEMRQNFAIILLLVMLTCCCMVPIAGAVAGMQNTQEMPDVKVTPTLVRSIPIEGGTVVVPVDDSTFQGRSGVATPIPTQ